jgi:mRNA-degrading endonuclease RelE of RelBE toxin-antitoxin system
MVLFELFTYEIRISRKVQKNLHKLPKNVQLRFVALAEQLRERGPAAHEWQNYSKLGEGRYH